MKKMMMRKYVVLAEAILLLVLLLLPSFALDGADGNIRWELSAGTLTLSGRGEMRDYTDAHMAPWLDSASAIKRIVVKEGITSIGDLSSLRSAEKP